VTNETLPIVERLRGRNRLRIDAGNEWTYDNLADEAADTVERLVEALAEARLQLEYLDSKIQPTGTTPAVLARIGMVLADVRRSA
jgi:hypothetical protein